MPVTTHALGVEGIRRAVEAGVHTIEQCGWVTEEGSRFDPAIAAKIAAAGIVVCPTMNTACLADPYFCPWDERDALLANLRGMLAARVKLGAGTDAGTGLVPFENYADGLDVLADAGMSPREVLAAADGQHVPDPAVFQLRAQGGIGAVDLVPCDPPR
jgi:imidazolonepropionase-like amidohydrolase